MTVMPHRCGRERGYVGAQFVRQLSRIGSFRHVISQ